MATNDITVTVDGVQVVNGQGPDGRLYIDARDDAGALVYRAMTDEEWAPFKADRDAAVAAALADSRTSALAHVEQLLAGTDKWAARAYEDGVPISDPRKAYRVALRGAYQAIAASDDPGSVTLPEPVS